MTIKQQGGVFGRNPTFNDVSVDDTLLVSGRIGVGTASPSTQNALTLDGEANYNGILLKKSGSSVARIMQESTGNLYIDAGITGTVGTGKNLIIRTNGGSSVFTFKNSGDLAFASGNGIDFSATAGTGTSELFDDYEEGTWTPASATNCTVNSVTSAFYTKVGRMVHCYCYVNITTTGLNFTIAGLPYVCTNGFGPASLYYLTGGGIASIYGSQQNYVNNGSSDLKLGLGATVTGALVMLTASYYN